MTCFMQKNILLKESLLLRLPASCVSDSRGKGTATQNHKKERDSAVKIVTPGFRVSFVL